MGKGDLTWKNDELIYGCKNMVSYLKQCAKPAPLLILILIVIFLKNLTIVW